MDEGRRREMLASILQRTPSETLTAVLKDLGLHWVRELQRTASGVEICLSRGQERCFLATCSNLADDTRVKSEANVKTAQTLGWKGRDGADPYTGMRPCGTHRSRLSREF